MAFKQFKKIKTDDRDLNLVQDNITSALKPIVANVALDSQVLTDVSLAAAKVTNVSHKLGRKLTGWCVIRIRSQAQIWDAQDANASPELLLNLHCSNDCTVDLLVF